MHLASLSAMRTNRIAPIPFNRLTEIPRPGGKWSIGGAKLGRVGVIPPFLPLLLAVRERWPNDASKYLEILKLCETFAFRAYRLTGSRADAGQSVLFHLGYDLAHKTENFEGVIKRLKANSHIGAVTRNSKGRTSANHQQIKASYYWSGLRYFSMNMRLLWP